MGVDHSTTLVEEADEVRQQDRQRALELYSACPTTLLRSDDSRVEWILSELQASSSEGFRDFLETVIDRSQQSLIRRQALHRLAVLEWYSGKLERAEELWRAALVEGRPLRDRHWALSCSNLALALRTRGRPLDALVLSGAVASIDESEIGADTRAYAEAYKAQILLDLGEVETASCYLQRASSRLPDIEQSLQQQIVQWNVLAAWTQLHLEKKDWTRALQAIADQERFAARCDGLPEVAQRLVEVHRLIACFEVEPTRRREVIDAATIQVTSPGVSSEWQRLWEIELRSLEMRYAVQDEPDPAVAERAARRRLELILEADASLRHVSALEEIGRYFTDVCPDKETAARAFDEAATVLLQQMVKVLRATNDMAELQEPSAEDREVLSAHRGRLDDMHASLLEAVRAHWHPGEPTFDLLVKKELVCVCAWCRRIRTRAGEWVFLEYFHPPEPVRVTHTICESCDPTTPGQ